MRARRIAVAAACTAVAASLCVIPASAQDGPSVLAERTLATKLDIPWDIEFLPDGSGIFTERDTRKIKKITGTTVTELDTVEQAQRPVVRADCSASRCRRPSRPTTRSSSTTPPPATTASRSCGWAVRRRSS